MKKFEIAKERSIIWAGRPMNRIRACNYFVTNDDVEINVGDLGGFVEKEENLSQDGNAWIFGDAKVYDNAKICDDAIVYGNAEVFCHAMIYCNAMIGGNAGVGGDAKIGSNAKVYGSARIWGNANIYGDARILDSATIHGDAEVFGDVRVCGNTTICGDAYVSSNGRILCVTSIEGTSITFFRTKGFEIKIGFNHKLFTVEEFKKLISKWNKREREVTIGVIELAQKYIG